MRDSECGISSIYEGFPGQLGQKLKFAHVVAELQLDKKFAKGVN